MLWFFIFQEGVSKFKYICRILLKCVPYNLTNFRATIATVWKLTSLGGYFLFKYIFNLIKNTILNWIPTTVQWKLSLGTSYGKCLNYIIILRALYIKTQTLNQLPIEWKRRNKFDTPNYNKQPKQNKIRTWTAKVWITWHTCFANTNRSCRPVLFRVSVSTFSLSG